MRIKIDGECEDAEYAHGMVTIGKREYYVFEDESEAGDAARKYWEDLAQDDPSEFACLVGEKTLVAWGMGQYSGPGSTQVKSLSDWLDLWLDTPEEHFASYDGNSCDVDECDSELEEEIGFKPTVAYRHN